MDGHAGQEFMPSELKEGIRYISIPYETAVHLCACGCGIKVVKPISPLERQLNWDGDTVSLCPSIGNWQFPCRSHYWIRRNSVEWARTWSEREIVEGRRRDAEELREYFASKSRAGSNSESTEFAPQRESVLRRVRRLLRRR